MRFKFCSQSGQFWWNIVERLISLNFCGTLEYIACNMLKIFLEIDDFPFKVFFLIAFAFLEALDALVFSFAILFDQSHLVFWLFKAEIVNFNLKILFRNLFSLRWVVRGRMLFVNETLSQAMILYVSIHLHFMFCLKKKHFYSILFFIKSIYFWMLL